MQHHDNTIPACALDDPKFRLEMQALKDMTAALNGVPTSPVVFSTDVDSVLKRKVTLNQEQQATLDFDDEVDDRGLLRPGDRT